MRVRREMGYGGMVLSEDKLKLAERYEWKAKIAGKPNANATLKFDLRKSAAASFGRTEYIYSGTLEVDGRYYNAHMSLFTIGPVTYGFIKASPH